MLSNQQHALQFAFLRKIAGGLRVSTARHLLLREFGCKPLASHWFTAAVRLWNKVAKRSRECPSDLLVCCMINNRHLAMQPPPAGAVQLHKSLWCSQFKQLVAVVGAGSPLFPSVDMLFGSSDADPLPEINEQAAVAAFDAFMYQPWGSLPDNPRTAARDRVVCGTYENWMAETAFSDLDMSHPASWCSSLHRLAGFQKAELHCLLRFRLGAHNLRVATGRWEGLARSQRVCERCVSGQVEDEFHLVFECSAYDDVRELHSHLFDEFGGWSQPTVRTEGRQMAAFMSQHPRAVARFLVDCFTIREVGPWYLDVDSASSASDGVASVLSDSDELVPVASDDELGLLHGVSGLFLTPHEPNAGS